MLAIGIVMHHLSEKTTDAEVIFHQMVHAGYLICAVFFFLSGYGCTLAYNHKGQNYIRNFQRHRVLYIAILFLFTSAVYAVFYVAIGQTDTLIRIVKALPTGSTVAMNSWYVVVQMLLYEGFYVAFKPAGLKPSTRILIVAGFTTLIAWIFSLRGFGSVWYLSNYAFVAGMICAQYLPAVNRLLRNHYGVTVAVALLGFALFSALPGLMANRGINTEVGGFLSVNHIARYLSSTAFVGVVVVGLYKIRFRDSWWGKIGIISLEIHLLHGMVYTFLRGNRCHVGNDALWVPLTILLALLVAWPAHHVTQYVSTKLRK